MAEPRGKQAADVRQPNGAVGGRPAGAEPSAQPAAQGWDSGPAPAGRPVTPAVEHGSFGWRHAPAPAPASMQQQQQPAQQQQRAGTPGSHATPPASRGGAGLLRAMRTSSNSLTGLLKRPGTAVPSRGGSPGGSPLFEVRGAAMLPPEPARPATSPAGGQAAPLQRPFTAAAPQQQQHKAAAGGSPYSIQARAGYRNAAGSAAGSPLASPQQAARHALAVVASHGLDLGTSPQAPALSLAQQLEAAAAARRQQQLQQQEPAQGAHESAAAAAVQPAPSPPLQGSSASASSSQASVYGAPSSSSSGGSRRASAANVPPARGPPFTTTTVHSNPLYSAGSEAYGRPRQPQLRPAHQAAQQPPAATPQQQQQQMRHPPPVRVSPPGAASTPQTPLASTIAVPSSATPGLSPLGGTLLAASNLTIVSDGRPISPGPFLSTLASSALPDTTSARTHSRPVSPQCVDSVPPTPGSFAPLGGAAATAARACSNLSPIKTASVLAAASRSQSLPSSPAPPSAAASAGAAAAASGASPAAAASAAATAFRLPIFNQDGRLVGYKQNSNLIPRPGACISSAPSSPARSGLLTGETFGQASADCASPSGAPKPAAAPAPPPGDTGDFAEHLADPCRGFPDADNMVPGYVLGPVLGKGGFCSVRKALHELTGQAVACKIIEKGKLKDPKDRDRVDRECRVMRNLSNHVAVIKLFEYVETRDYVYIMMEAAKRGSLLDYVRDRKKLPEAEAVTIFQQLLHALQFCHRKDVVHRDIKLENILIDSAGHMKLIDFGLCGYYVAGKRLRCHCGSPSYAAPEIVARKDYLGPPVDVWSLGIVLFAMLAGYLPFHAKEKKQLSEKILSGVYKPAAWMSPEAQDLIARMLTLDPEQRITLEAVWAHPWVVSAPRWEPPGVGSGRLYRALTDPTNGAILPDDAVLAQLEQLGADSAAIRRALRSRECNSLTATYHLMLESRLEGQRAAAAHERAAAADRAAALAAAKAKGPAPASTAGDWQWDFASISAAATAAAGPAAASGSGAVGSHSAGSSSLRGSSSPARSRPATVAALPGGSSPTRFGQEAAAAGYFSSPRRLAPAGPHHAAAQAAPGGEWDIKAVRPPAVHTSAAAAAAAPPEPAAVAAALATVAAAAAAELTPPAGPTPIILATSVVAGDSPTGVPKSPVLSPLPTALSPKQLTLVPAGASSGSGGGEQSPPIAQAV
ncbi:hypothetical protein ABPG75_010659 [Micractinium tetrahymenae]